MIDRSSSCVTGDWRVCDRWLTGRHRVWQVIDVCVTGDWQVVVVRNRWLTCVWQMIDRSSSSCMSEELVRTDEPMTSQKRQRTTKKMKTDKKLQVNTTLWQHPLFISCQLSPLRSNRHHRSNDDCLESKGKIIRFVLCCIVFNSKQLCTVHCTHIWTDLTVVSSLDLAFLCLCCVLQFIHVRFSFLGLFCIIGYLCMCAFVVLDLVSSVLCQEIG